MLQLLQWIFVDAPYAERAWGVALDDNVTVVTVVTGASQLSRAGLMGVYEEGDGWTTEGKREVMSIGFSFLSSASEERTR